MKVSQITLLRLRQDQNAASPKYDTCLGILIFAKLQPLKAYSPMYVRISGRSIYVRFSQLQNAYGSITVILSGSLRFTRLVQP